MHEWPILVISSKARDLAFSATCEEKISRLWLETTIATHSRPGGKKEVGVTLFAIYRLDLSKLYIDAIGSI